MKFGKGSYKFAAEYPDGSVVKREGHNLLVSTGRVSLMTRIMGDTVSSPTHVAFGTGTDVPVLADIGLIDEYYAFDIASSPDVTEYGIYIADDKKTFGIRMEHEPQITYSGISFTCNEAGIFGRVGGKWQVMYARFLPQSILFTDGMKYNFSWELTFEDVE